MKNKDLNNKYKDLIAGDVPEGFKKLEPVRGRRIIAPKIKWGDEYKSWSMKDQLSYAERVASSMNEAADLLQKERNELAKLLTEKEHKLVSSIKEINDLKRVVEQQITTSNEEKQELFVHIVKLQKTIKKQKLYIEKLEQPKE